MKNNNEAAAFHVDDYDMVVNEECWINGNCANYVRRSPSDDVACISALRKGPQRSSVSIITGGQS